MPLYLDSEHSHQPADAAPAGDAPGESPRSSSCEWLVVELWPGCVSLSVPGLFPAPTFSVQLTRVVLPQLRLIVELLEKDQPAS